MVIELFNITISINIDIKECSPVFNCHMNLHVCVSSRGVREQSLSSCGNLPLSSAQ